MNVRTKKGIYCDKEGAEEITTVYCTGFEQKEGYKVKELINALEVIKKECENQTEGCKECLMFNDNSEQCIFDTRAPGELEVGEFTITRVVK